MYWVVIFVSLCLATSLGVLDNPHLPWRSTLKVQHEPKDPKTELCKLPPYPKDGGYVVVDAPRGGPGDLYQNVSIVRYIRDRRGDLQLDLMRCSSGRWTQYIFNYNSDKMYFNASWCPFLCDDWLKERDSMPVTTVEPNESLENPTPIRCKVPPEAYGGRLTVGKVPPGKTYSTISVHRYVLDETSGVYEVINLECADGRWTEKFFIQNGGQLTFFQRTWCPYFCTSPRPKKISEPAEGPYLSIFKVSKEENENERRCELPPYPEGGNYTALHRPEALPGDATRDAHLSYACHGNARLVGSKHVYCVEGVWSDVAPICISCGRIRSFALEPTSAEDAARREVPWHVAVYDKTRGHEHVCSGSIIATNLIITAAHCLWVESEGPRSAEHFAVAAGKTYGDWNSTHDEDTQKRQVTEIIIHPRFQGRQTNYHNNIALMYLDAPLNYNDYVGSVCVDFDPELDEKQLTDGNYGKIASWSATSENGTDVSKLKVDWMPYIDANKCISISSPSVLQYVTNDKICAGDLQGTALCRSDGGGSLSYQERDENGARVSYLRGVASLTHAHDSTCDVQPVTVYTHLLHHEDFIEENSDKAMW